jgi:Ca-activated chloride channel family protein
MSFRWPILLLSLVIVPLAYLAWRALERRRMRYALVFPNVDVALAVTGGGRPWRRIVPLALALLALAVTCVAIARPQVTVQGKRQQATVVLLVDVSRSMVANDVHPSRLGAARQAIQRFLKRIPPGFSVGIVAFSSTPSVASPVTTDRTVTRAAVGYLLPETGTAIGDGLALAVKVGVAARRQQQSLSGANTPPPVTILMLSDGAQRTGVLQPDQGARLARRAGIRIYTIALGTATGVVKVNLRGFEQEIPVPPDPDTLRRISRLSDGEFFPAPTASALQSAYGKISARVATQPVDTEATGAFAAAAAVLLLGAGALSTLWGSRLP